MIPNSESGAGDHGKPPAERGEQSEDDAIERMLAARAKFAAVEDGVPSPRLLAKSLAAAVIRGDAMDSG